MEDLKKVVDDVEGIVTSAEAVVKGQTLHSHTVLVSKEITVDSFFIRDSVTRFLTLGFFHQ
jgi:hypothetical protein